MRLKTIVPGAVKVWWYDELLGLIESDNTGRWFISTLAPDCPIYFKDEIVLADYPTRRDAVKALVGKYLELKDK